MKGIIDSYLSLIDDGFEESNAWDIAFSEMHESFEDAEYQGKPVTLNKPFRNEDGKKKFSVYVQNKRGSIIKVSFGDPDMEIKRDNSDNKKAFRARHKCDERNDKTTPAYWSCKLWSNEKVSEIVDSKIKTSFNDKICFDAGQKFCASARDGFQEYHCSELGIEGDKMIKVYRSPETIADIVDSLDGLKVTDNHVPLTEISDNDVIGEILDSELVEHLSEDTDTSLIVRNKINVSDEILNHLKNGKKELSLGYHGDIIEHDVYDFEVVNVEPHHLALVERGRCGGACSFEDKIGDKPMDKEIYSEFALLDDDGEINMSKVMDLMQKLPEMVKNADLEQVKKLYVALQEVLANSQEMDESVNNDDIVTEDEEAEADAEAVESEKVEDEEAEEAEKVEDEEAEESDKQGYSDADFADAVAKKAQELADEKMAVINKAKDFLDAGYDFSKPTAEIMRDAVETQHTGINDEELSTAFKMLKPKTDAYASFGKVSTKHPLERI